MNAEPAPLSDLAADVAIDLLLALTDLVLSMQGSNIVGKVEHVRWLTQRLRAVRRR